MRKRGIIPENLIEQIENQSFSENENSLYTLLEQPKSDKAQNTSSFVSYCSKNASKELVNRNTNSEQKQKQNKACKKEKKELVSNHKIEMVSNTQDDYLSIKNNGNSVTADTQIETKIAKQNAVEPFDTEKSSDPVDKPLQREEEKSKISCIIDEEILPKTVLKQYKTSLWDTDEKSVNKSVLNRFFKMDGKFINITVSVAVCSLGGKMGCTHFSRSLVSYVHSVLRKKACIVSYDGQTDKGGLPVYQKEEIASLYDEYDFIIQDFGKYEKKFDKEVVRSQIRIMCSFFEEKYIKELAKFINQTENSGKWWYFFNNVPPNRTKQIDDLMEDYNYWCVPVYDSVELGRDVINEFNIIFSR